MRISKGIYRSIIKIMKYQTFSKLTVLRSSLQQILLKSHTVVLKYVNFNKIGHGVWPVPITGMFDLLEKTYQYHLASHNLSFQS